MITKTEVIHALLTTISLSLDSLILVIMDECNQKELQYHRSQIEQVGKSLTRLSSILTNTEEPLTVVQLDDLQSKYRLLTSKLTHKHVA